MKRCTNRKRASKTWTSVQISGNTDTIKHWCQHNGSDSRFISGNAWTTDIMYFENPEDAVAITLKWGKKVR